MLLREIIAWISGTPTVGDERSHRRFYSRRDLWEKRVYLWWLYPAIGLYTFGHCATNSPVFDYQSYEEERDGVPPERDRFGTALQATVAGALWPMYWTWEVMEDDS